MTANVETMAWSGEVPWHGLGVKVDGNLTSKEMLEAAQLNWSVSLRKMQFSDKDGKFPKPGIVSSFSALVRDSDEKVLDVVGSRWQPTQNVEAFEFFNEYVTAGDATMETAGSLNDGRMVWGLANLKRSFSIGKDRMDGYLLMALPHEQGKSIRALLTEVRVVCSNTMAMALRGGNIGFRMSHRRAFDTMMQNEAKVTLGIAREQFDERKENVQLLARTKIGREDSLKFFAELIDPSLLKFDVMEAFETEKAPKDFLLCGHSLERSPGADLPSAKETLWGTVNAVTYAVDHLFGRGQDQRMMKAWFGKGASLKQRAFELALKKAK